MLAAARIRPAPTHQVAPVLDHRPAIWCDDAGRDHVGIPPEDCFGAWISEASPHIHGVPAGNPDTPRGRRVDAGQRFHDAIEREGVHLQPAEGVGGVHPKETGFCQRSHYRLGEAALLLGLIGLGANQGFKGAHSVEQPVESMSVRCGHRASPLWASEVRPVWRCVCVFRCVGRSSHSDRSTSYEKTPPLVTFPSYMVCKEEASTVGMPFTGTPVQTGHAVFPHPVPRWYARPRGNAEPAGTRCDV